MTVPQDSDGKYKSSVVILSHRPLFDIPLKEIWNYRYLLLILVKRDFVTIYKQTILGPIWILLQPILITLMFTLVFGNIAKLSTDGLPQILFYMAGVTCWAYFSESLTKISETFFQNANIFGKVYFPRIIIPLSVLISLLIKFSIQFVLFLVFVGWYMMQSALISPNVAVLLLPVFLMLLGGLGLGSGLIICALTTKYRDLRFLLTFGVQLLMYATPIIYPASAIPDQYSLILEINPITPVIEGFRYAFLGQGDLTAWGLAYSFGFMICLLFIGTVIFNRVEQSFMDTV